MTRSLLRCCTSIIWSSALVQVSSSLSIRRTCAWPRELPVTEMHFRHFSHEFFSYHSCNCAMGRCKCSCFCTNLREKALCILHHCIPPASLSYARGHHVLHGARVMLSEGSAVWKQRGIMMCDSKKRTMTCSWVRKEGGRLWGGGLGGARRARLLPTEGRSAGPSTFASVFCAPSSSCLSFQSLFWFILWWSSSLCVCMLNLCVRRYSHVFETPLHAYVEEGWAGFFQLVYLFPV